MRKQLATHKVESPTQGNTPQFQASHLDLWLPCP